MAFNSMKLTKEPFNAIKNQTKTVELRLNDEKRRQIKPHDIIVFTNIDTNEQLITKVIDLYQYPNFQKLYQDFDKISLGYKPTEKANPTDMEIYYSKEKQQQYGVLAIKLKTISLFEAIKNDNYITNIYNEISQNEDKDSFWAHHNYDHVLNVANIAEQLLTSLNYDEEFIDKAKVAALLHDIGVTEGKEGHAKRSYDKAQKYFIDHQIYFEELNQVLDAIKIHSDGFDTNNILALVLILADKLDITKTRIAKAGYQIPGMRELRFINDIKINIKKGTLEVNFTADNQINIQELSDFYFIKKVFKAINSFANKMNLKAQVLMNEKPWIVDID